QPGLPAYPGRPHRGAHQGRPQAGRAARGLSDGWVGADAAPAACDTDDTQPPRRDTRAIQCRWSADLLGVAPCPPRRAGMADITGLLGDAIEALTDGFLIYDAEERVVLCNAAISRYLGGLPVVPGQRAEELFRAYAASLPELATEAERDAY